ncbi:Proteinase inhibitor I13, potato inhibitor I [Corchorus capsularis]|uniref:Proteinase inhibitor I13, potato inhibitor I n=1 Tax=Corchorus capsularis TaxID=210143 RepID=A0A1R3JZU1_COCAP|nr:Proteinase inhibitor I13, potato inhibitor I [Corchorus capsularis]
MADECQGKSSWPELLGANGEIAAATIESENPNVNAVIVLDSPETIITPDFLCTRVRVWVHTNGNVTRVPVIG